MARLSDRQEWLCWLLCRRRGEGALGGIWVSRDIWEQRTGDKIRPSSHVTLGKSLSHFRPQVSFPRIEKFHSSCKY